MTFLPVGGRRTGAAPDRQSAKGTFACPVPPRYANPFQVPRKGRRDRSWFRDASRVRGFRPGSGLASAVGEVRPRPERSGGAGAGGATTGGVFRRGGGRLRPGWYRAMRAASGGVMDSGLAGGLPGGGSWRRFVVMRRGFCPGSGLASAVGEVRPRLERSGGAGVGGRRLAAFGGGMGSGLVGGLSGRGCGWGFEGGGGLRLRLGRFGCARKGTGVRLRRPPAGSGWLRPGWDGAMRGAPGGGMGFGLVGGLPGGRRWRRFGGRPKRAGGGGG